MKGFGMRILVFWNIKNCSTQRYKDQCSSTKFEALVLAKMSTSEYLTWRKFGI